MIDLRKYGVATHLYVAIRKRASADFAIGADWTPVAGDVKISKDGGAAANVANLPVAIAMGNTAMWDFSLTLAEMQAAQVRVTVADSPTKAVEDRLLEIVTYGDPAALHPLDLGTAMSGQAVASVVARVNVAETVRKNVALANFQFLMTDSITHAPVAGKTVTVTRLIDNGTFGAGTLSAVTEVGNGIYRVDFAAADLNGNTILLRAAAAGCDDTFERLITTP